MYQPHKIIVVDKRYKNRQRLKYLAVIIFTALVTHVLTLGASSAYIKSIGITTQEVELPAMTSAPSSFEDRVQLVEMTIDALYNIPEDRLSEYASLIVENSNYQGFPTEFDVIAVIAIESRFDENARSWADARGLMQVMKGDYDIKKNIRQGTSILREYYASVGENIPAALQAYNVGITAYKRDGVRNDGYVQKFQYERNRISRYKEKELLFLALSN